MGLKIFKHKTMFELLKYAFYLQKVDFEPSIFQHILVIIKVKNDKIFSLRLLCQIG